MMRRYGKILWRVLKMSIMSDMQYPTNVKFGIGVVAMFFVFQLLFLWLLFSQVNFGNMIGFSIWQYYFVMGVFNMICGLVYILVADNAWIIRDNIYRGLLDIDLLKPLNSFFISFFKRFNLIEQMPGVLYSAIFVLYIFLSGRLSLDFNQILLLVLLIFQSMVVWLMLFVVAGIIELYISRFWVLMVFTYESENVCVYPKKIYPVFLQNIFMFVWPILLVVSPIYGLFDKSLSIDDLLIGFGVSIIFFVLVVFMWNNGLKRYQSAG